MNSNKSNFPDLLRQHGIQPKKSLGQNFIFDENIIHRIIELAGISSRTPVLEIGAGPGNMTRGLVACGGRVVAIELDDRFLPLLEQLAASHPNLEIVHANVLKLDLDTLMGSVGYLVVANLPYYITSAVIRKLLETRQKPIRLALTVQKEVALRICAKPGELSVLAVSVRIYGEPQLSMNIPAGAFYPMPKVDSAVVLIHTHPSPLIPKEHTDHFFRIVKAGFSQKRKMLRNTIAAGMHLTQPACEHLFKSAGIDPTRRAQTLDIAEWIALTEEFIRQNPNLDA
ncbi:MAG: ribosomal RNA small subunit methyltransferase A [Anaerolineaceae bacterium]|nr:ribosomal RNA small subunit methyltransferase A [Anaerolineaceae bacterium]MBN2678144.1 ribosomal RNA small subunit methyltransferase A [Anaerolineaceae bacterium]